uniref:Uncharacterized protein n=1 Tax=Brassica oleracea var. oleracea TaxID=109376 RepID=A0A0D3D8V1_BRAOL
MLEEVRRLAMKRNSRRRDKTSGCSTPFPPNIMEIFEQNRKASDHCTVIKSSESLYEVSEFDCCYKDDPWSIQNAPKRRRNAQSQLTPNPVSTQPCIDPQPSTAPQPSNAPNVRGRGRPRGRGRGRGRARGSEREPLIPRESGCYISPFSGRVFD